MSSRCPTTPVRATPGLEAGTTLDSPVSMSYDRVPKGEVELRRASAVISADGHSLGEVDGFVVDADENITHFVLERGHLWGRKEITIPIGAVARIENDVVHVALSKDEVGALPDRSRRPTRLTPRSLRRRSPANPSVDVVEPGLVARQRRERLASLVHDGRSDGLEGARIRHRLR